MWFYCLQQTDQQGPVDEQALHDLYERGLLSDGLVWREGMSDWLSYEDAFPDRVRPVAPALAPTPVAPPARPPSPSPYAPPMQPSTGSGEGPPPGNPLTIPAIVLIVLASLMLLIFPLATLVAVSDGSLDFSPQGGTPEDIGEFIGQIIGVTMIPVANLFALIGGIFMLRRRRIGLARTGAIFACIPVCSPCYFGGIPFAIWALVVMSRPEVKASFR